MNKAQNIFQGKCQTVMGLSSKLDTLEEEVRLQIGITNKKMRILFWIGITSLILGVAKLGVEIYKLW
jgi:hypothetical protein